MNPLIYPGPFSALIGFVAGARKAMKDKKEEKSGPSEDLTKRLILAFENAHQYASSVLDFNSDPVPEQKLFSTIEITSEFPEAVGFKPPEVLIVPWVPKNVAARLSISISTETDVRVVVDMMEDNSIILHDSFENMSLAENRASTKVVEWFISKYSE